jgi:glycerol-3-phosphate dehydrogenase
MTARPASTGIPAADPTALHATRRARELEVLAAGEVVDVLVVGGGITGVGVALDAASRGLSVALVERRDLANGTSRWSSKLVHGGLRYLAKGQVGIALDSARERRILMERTAPHLIRPLPIVMPLHASMSRGDTALATAGQWAGDGLRALAGTDSGTLPKPRRVGAVEASQLVPAVRRHDLRGGLVFWDGQLEDDARLVVAVARTAAGLGARILTRCAVTSVAPDGAAVTDELTGDHFVIHARHVVNATGVWADSLDAGVRLRPSKGAHLVLRGQTLGNPAAAMSVPVPGESFRYVFALPHPDGHVYVGLTDDPASGPIPDEPTVDGAEERFLLATLSRALAIPLGPEDVVGRFAGYRPLLAGSDPAADDDKTADLSRSHLIRESDGVLTVVGGKLTTYRQMAEEVVDRIAARDGVEAGPCRTRDLPLVGAASAARLERVRAPQRLVRRYGLEAPLVHGLGAAEPSLLDPIAPGLEVLGVELRFGLTHEGALTVDDLLDRRTRLGLVPADRAEALPAASLLMGAHAGA